MRMRETIMNEQPSESALTRLPEQPESFGAMVQRAIDKGVPVETMERLLAMYEKLQARQAKADFDRALASFQAECPTIQKTKKVMNKDGRSVRYQYAPLEVIVQQVKSLLQLHGFSYTVDAEVEPGLVRATCKATHQAGHSQTSTFSVPIDKDAFMNPAQQCASALTFAKRYAFVNAFGILTGDEDDDSISSHESKSKTAQRQQPAQKPSTVTGTAKSPGSESGEPSGHQLQLKWRKWLVEQLHKLDPPSTAKSETDGGWTWQYFLEKQWIGPEENLEDMLLAQMPVTLAKAQELLTEVQNWIATRKAENSAEPSQKPVEAAPKKASEPAHHSEDWYQFLVPFGEDKGRMLGELDKKKLFGWWCNYEVKTTYNGKPKKPETIAADEHFRAMLDQAGAFYKFEEPA